MNTVSYNLLGKFGRLGNCMFQYASTLGIARKLNRTPTASISQVDHFSNCFKLGSVIDKIIEPTGTDKEKEKERLEKYSYEYFITYTPDQNGNTSTVKTKTVAGSKGSSVAEGTTYKSGGTSTGTHYTIFSCGCNAARSNCKQGNNTIVNLIADVVLVQ